MAKQAVQVGLTGYIGLLCAFGVVFSEFFFRTIMLLMPVSYLKKLWTVISSSPTRRGSSTALREDTLGRAYTTPEIIQSAGYPVEEHIVRTSDGFLLVLHRIPPKDRTVPLKPVLMMHGFLMSSEVWAASTQHCKGLAYLLADAGYDVWLGNNRGNKYSNKHTEYKPSEDRFWDFSIDELAMCDIPAMVEYIIDATSAPSLSYVGFSQGTAQAFAAFSVQHELATKINLFIALAPATKVKEFAAGLGEFLIDPLIFASPLVLFLLFGKRAFLPTTLIWQHSLPAVKFASIIDWFNKLLFGWHGTNISSRDKSFLYHHLYSTSSVKVVIHWCQILRANRFQMFDERANGFPSGGYVPIAYPLHQISCPVALFYGGSDSLPDSAYIVQGVRQSKLVHCKEISHYEHLDFLWAKDAQQLVYEPLLDILEKHTAAPPVLKTDALVALNNCSPSNSTASSNTHGHSEAGGTDGSNSWEEVHEQHIRQAEQQLRRIHTPTPMAPPAPVPNL
eukprot:TRINITY_DN61232_c0_g1_i1.p1 TRINITY_DN61232_c0_g1~~TRINITY_DN61232_c0_g1_i1.p1  ORF type:complete len:505 (-),score=31.17 TRINITY_DN61232_c0_g1_i1:1223-2737(-)